MIHRYMFGNRLLHAKTKGLNCPYILTGMIYHRLCKSAGLNIVGPRNLPERIKNVKGTKEMYEN